MIITTLVAGVFYVITWILSKVGNIVGFPAGSLTAAITYISEILDKGCGLMFFVIRPATFQAAVDILFFLHTAIPLYNFVMWVLRKIPFLGIE